MKGSKSKTSIIYFQTSTLNTVIEIKFSQGTMHACIVCGVTRKYDGTGILVIKAKILLNTVTLSCVYIRYHHHM